ncbi:hypothetical protein Lal_00044688 [Lupinus albus]|nr:hypothetical protein Lal_00044688 [Lupinus albus]
MLIKENFAWVWRQEFLEENSEEFKLYKAHSDNFICSLISGTPGFQAIYTPGGLLYKGSSSNLQYVTTTSFLLLTYAKYLNSNGENVVSCGTTTFTRHNIISLAKKQVDYILGNNPTNMSYMVGFGDKYPKHIHHRGSPNPNDLVGTIVGGPDSNDNFSDDRNNYQQSEPATYINAPFVGALAFFSSKP